MKSPHHLSLAWPVAGVFALLIVYASLYPFTGWRFQGIEPWAFVLAPWPRYWTGFDVLSNLVGYVPLGLLLTLAVARTGSGRGAWWAGTLGAWALSAVMETMQSFLPLRVPSNVDWWLNGAGGALGATVAVLLLRWRILGPWNQFRTRCLVPQTHGGMVLLLLWPVATLYPTSIPFGLGQVWQRAQAALWDLFDGSWLAAWLPQPLAMPPLSPLAQAMVLGLCLTAPLLMGYALLKTVVQRAVFLFLMGGLVMALGALSAILTYGPSQAWVWLTPPVTLGLSLFLGFGLITLRLRHRTCSLFMVLAWAFALGWLNRAPDTPYLAQSVQIWEQGRFIRFHGLSQWLGWLWPYAAIWVGLRQVLAKPSHAT